MKSTKELCVDKKSRKRIDKALLEMQREEKYYNIRMFIGGMFLFAGFAIAAFSAPLETSLFKGISLAISLLFIAIGALTAVDAVG